MRPPRPRVRGARSAAPAVEGPRLPAGSGLGGPGGRSPGGGDRLPPGPGDGGGWGAPAATARRRCSPSPPAMRACWPSRGAFPPKSGWRAPPPSGGLPAPPPAYAQIFKLVCGSHSTFGGSIVHISCQFCTYMSRDRICRWLFCCVRRFSGWPVTFFYPFLCYRAFTVTVCRIHFLIKFKSPIPVYIGMGQML